MERIHCQNCNQPTMHQHKNFYGDSIHGAPRCLSCGRLQLTPEHIETMEALNELEASLMHAG